MTNSKNVNVYDRHVKVYVSRFMDLGAYAATFDALLRHVPENAKVLELGCGPGNVIKYLLSKRPDLNITGIDLSHRMIEEAKRQNHGCIFHIMDINKAHDI